ncbi:hypothetical protein COV18_00690 [Candidatus Woesearchaeota archaeon CG10_big_fil_rev_8_21_14_0_10_37_12]|nr:MAG: hypothetical protein COV18_00690 [Candidatus Woesearchaeota archaeon CG10_big_fil_rev_8_21_14_0_10_37_12]
MIKLSYSLFKTFDSKQRLAQNEELLKEAKQEREQAQETLDEIIKKVEEQKRKQNSTQAQTVASEKVQRLNEQQLRSNTFAQGIEAFVQGLYNGTTVDCTLTERYITDDFSKVAEVYKVQILKYKYKEQIILCTFGLRKQ